MTKNQLITNLYNNKYKWLLQVSYNLTQNKDDAEDLIQELFVKLAEYKNIDKLIFLERELNLFYVFKMLRSIFINQAKKNKHQFVDLNAETLNIETSEYNYDADTQWENDYKSTLDAIQSLEWFDRKLLETYIDEGHSIASLSTATNISKSTIFTSLKNSKIIVRTYVTQSR
jgi:DNA-directed RNA polymerase specialized sigma24 family protein